MTPAPVADRLAEHARALAHWRLAARRLGELDAIAPRDAWQRLEHYLGVSIRAALGLAVRNLDRTLDEVDVRLRAATTADDAARVHAALMAAKAAYVRTESTVDFFADAILTRASATMGALLRACDHLATRAMAEALTPLGRQVPAALTFADAGLGAAILRAGVRLWDGGVENPVAAIKVTRHNILRPTAVLHEAGHAVAHMTGWNDELAAALRESLADAPDQARLWSGWASEIAADAFAFVHTGYAAVAALHEVVDGRDDAVYQYLPADSHPTSVLRLLLGVAMCRRAFGTAATAPWERLAAVWTTVHPLAAAPDDLRALLAEAERRLPAIVETVLYRPYRAFGARPLTRLVDPARVAPAALERLAREAGAAAYTSPYWIWNEAIRILALTGYQAGLDARNLTAAAERQERVMLRLGAVRLAA